MIGGECVNSWGKTEERRRETMDLTAPVSRGSQSPENYILAVDFLAALVDFLAVLVDLVVDLSAAKVAEVRPRMSPRPMAMLAIFFIVFSSPWDFRIFDDRFV